MTQREREAKEARMIELDIAIYGLWEGWSVEDSQWKTGH